MDPELTVAVENSRTVIRVCDQQIAVVDAMTVDDVRADPEEALKFMRAAMIACRNQAELLIKFADAHAVWLRRARSDGIAAGGTAAVAGMLSVLPRPATRLQDAVMGAVRPANDKPRARP